MLKVQVAVVVHPLIDCQVGSYQEAVAHEQAHATNQDG